MKFTTPVLIPTSNFNLSHQSQILSIGSCFAESIADKLTYHKFNVCKNPFGIIYNPVSVAKSLKRLLNKDLYSKEELILFNEKWLSLDHHGCFSMLDKSECLTKINQSIEEAHTHIKESKTLLITLGSAWVYEYPNFGIVANCHKIPNKEFNKRLLSVKEIITAFDTVKDGLKDVNVVFTVSPVRHSKEGLHENNLSKSTLHLAINNLVQQNKNYYYFPAYELVIDELRDYRFYKDDLVHPTELAVNYVWEKFGACYFDTQTQQLNTEIAKIQSALSHKPFNTESEEYQKFVATTQEEIDSFNKKYPYVQF